MYLLPFLCWKETTNSQQWCLWHEETRGILQHSPLKTPGPGDANHFERCNAKHICPTFDHGHVRANTNSLSTRAKLSKCIRLCGKAAPLSWWLILLSIYIYITSYDYILYTHIGLIYYIIHSIYQCIESKSTEFHEFMGPFIVLSSKANNISISNSLMPFVWTAIKFVQVGQNGMQRGTGKSYTENLRKASNTALFSALHIFRNNCFGDHTSYPDHMLKSIKSPTVLSLRLVRFPCIEAWADHITNPRLACELIHL